MRCVFFLQTSNLHPNKQKYKSEKETFMFIIQNNNNNKKHIKVKNKKDKSFLKELKHEPNLVEITHLCIRHRLQTSIYLYMLCRAQQLIHRYIFGGNVVRYYWVCLGGSFSLL